VVLNEPTDLLPNLLREIQFGVEDWLPTLVHRL
jgi:hypothetical protein